MKKIYFLFAFFIGGIAFGQTNYSPRLFVKACKKYKGTPYKFGGNDKRGIDCSGVIRNAFTSLDVTFPRVSYQQAEVFRTIKLKKARKGDLLYFKTAGSRINHTGVVVKKRGSKKLMFLHASSSGGVRIDNLKSDYWNARFVKITRPIEYSR
ncbi:C40 family peptidase [Arcticibacterium luteifluviistationis]|uniref:Glycoside hydrolase n=1 Tax=Arcticibacterium luteifluviistationis TaxID=1784714 RepID=A0A2Z4G6X9_9BACT|nr:C40 family peptidase [Arcticibacterium luteifluviistationis]AWV96909.1 glycoside hydrolase [Arcticibacterium luteifluviistationis]